MAISRFSTSRLTQGLPKSQDMWDQDTAQGAMEPIGTYVANGLSASATFTNIPQHYKHLMVSVFGRSSYLGTNTTYSVYLNNAIYGLTSLVALTGDGSTISTGRQVGGSYGLTVQVPGIDAPANFFGASVVNIMNYTSGQNKLMFGKSGVNVNQSSGPVLQMASALYRDTSPVTLVSIATNGSFVGGSVVTLYGIKGSV